MRTFEFQLQLPDGRLITSRVNAEVNAWGVAFTEACLDVEQRLDLGPWAGLICASYRSWPADNEEATCGVVLDDAGNIRLPSFQSFRSAA